MKTLAAFIIAIFLPLNHYDLSTASGAEGQIGTSINSHSMTDTVYLSLEQAVKMALEKNEDVKIAVATLDKAKGRKKEAYSAALPNLSTQAGYTRNILRPVIFFPNPDTDETMKIEIGETNDFLAVFSLVQPIYAFGRIGGAIKIADYFLKSSEKDLSSAKKKVILEVKEAYYAALLTEEALDISRQTLLQARKHYKETLSRLRQQMASRFDSLRAEVKVKNTEPLVVSAENNLSLAEMDLKRIIGLKSSSPIKLTDRLEFEAIPIRRKKALEKALANRPDVKSLRLRAAMAEKVYKVTKRNNYPFLSLVGNYIIEGQESDRFFPRKDRIAKSLSLGLSLTFPIFDGLANRGRTAQARADLNIVRYSLQKMEKAVELQIAQLCNEMETDMKNLDSQKATVSMAEEAYRLALVRYRNGLSTSLELSDAELALTNARLNYLQAVYQCIITRERLESAMGT